MHLHEQVLLQATSATLGSSSRVNRVNYLHQFPLCPVAFERAHDELRSSSPSLETPFFRATSNNTDGTLAQQWNRKVVSSDAAC
jgi:hypothetical protein